MLVGFSASTNAKFTEGTAVENEEQEKKKCWKDDLDPRMRKHVEFALAYVRDFGHGCPGHLDLLTIATLSDLLTAADGRCRINGGL